MNVQDLLAGNFSDQEPQLDIAVGDSVRSYDFAGTRSCYVEGVVEALTGPMEGCRRYKVRVQRRVFDNQEVAVDPQEEFVYPPLNGTATFSRGRTNFVVRLPASSAGYSSET